MLVGFRAGADRDGVGGAVGNLDGYDRRRTRGKRRARHDPVCRTGFERERVGTTGRDVFGDGQQHGLLGRRGGDVVGDDGVPVHRGVVEAGQRQRGDDIVGQHQTQRVGERQGDRPAAGDQTGDDAPVLFDGAHQTG